MQTLYQIALNFPRCLCQTNLVSNKNWFNHHYSHQWIDGRKKTRCETERVNVAGKIELSSGSLTRARKPKRGSDEGKKSPRSFFYFSALNVPYHFYA